MKEIPPYYRGIKEFEYLSETVSDKWEDVDHTLQNVENDQFITTSSVTGVALREKDFKIIADKNETLQFRKMRLLARMKENAEYTFLYFKKLLKSTVGSGNVEVYRDIINLEMEILLGLDVVSFLDYIEETAERLVPLNFTLFIKTKLPVNECIGSLMLSGEIVTVYPYISEEPIKVDINQKSFAATHSSGEVVTVYPK